MSESSIKKSNSRTTKKKKKTKKIIHHLLLCHFLDLCPLPPLLSPSFANYLFTSSLSSPPLHPYEFPSK